MGVSKAFRLTMKDIKTLSGSRRERATRLYEKASFMDKELQKLQGILEEKGWTEEYQNGKNQSGIKKSAEADVYTTLSKNYLAVMKELNEMLANVQEPEREDTLAQYI